MRCSQSKCVFYHRVHSRLILIGLLSYQMHKRQRQTQTNAKKPRGGKSLADFPEIMNCWDKVRNDEDPNQIHPGTLKKAYWICEHGHSYQRSIRSQTINGLSCRVCNSFGHNHPDLVESWHPRNAMSAFEISKASGRKVWWRCGLQHEWQSVVYSRSKHGCPYCAGQRVTVSNNFAQKKPKLAKFWDHNKNKEKPENVAWQTSKRFWFICNEGHEFSSKLNNISNGKWCPFCSGQKVGYGNSLADLNPVLASQWNTVRNLKRASDYRPNSNKKVWWICDKGHEWEANINSRNSGSGCPYCANRAIGYGNSLLDLFPEIAAEINHEKSPCDPAQLGAKSSYQLWWKCDRGHTWQAPISRRTVEKRGCRFCSSQTSLPEIRLYTELKSIFPQALGREKVSGYELDILLPKLKIGVEYDGSYFHRNNDDRDTEKLNALTALGFSIFRMREEPLALSCNDTGVKANHEAPSKNEIDYLLRLMMASIPAIQDVCEAYCALPSFAADKEFRRICSYLPGPPEENSLAELVPDLLNQWNTAKNYPLAPSMFHPRSGKKVWWICELGHEWEATIDKRAGSGRGCPYCSNKKVGYGNSLADRYPEIAEQWYQPQNGEITPDKVTFGSGAKVWWKCENNHIHQARVVDKTIAGKGCAYCPGKGKNRKYKPPKFDS